ncbi:hypothetical protein D3C86_1754850 [compost metagenome]
MNFPRESAKAAGTPSASDRMVVATASAALKVRPAVNSSFCITAAYQRKVKPCGGKVTK